MAVTLMACYGGPPHAYETRPPPPPEPCQNPNNPELPQDPGCQPVEPVSTEAPLQTEPGPYAEPPPGS